MKQIATKDNTEHHRYREALLYLFFGICTTAINTISYVFLHNYFEFSNSFSTIIAWIVAVIFAFFSNRTFVFSHRQTSSKSLRKELAVFTLCRLTTGVLDLIIMVVAVDLLKWNNLIWKLISNAIVTIINYVASKFMIFKDSAD